MYPSEGIHRRWDTGYRITATAATTDQAAFVLSVPKKKLTDETQETLRTSAFPSTHVKVWFVNNVFVLRFICILILPSKDIQNTDIVIFCCLTGEMVKKFIHSICLLWTDCIIGLHENPTSL